MTGTLSPKDTVTSRRYPSLPGVPVCRARPGDKVAGLCVYVLHSSCFSEVLKCFITELLVL